MGWPQGSIIKVNTKRTQAGHTATEVRYYISSLTVSAAKFLHIVRSHWKIENSLHWLLDVSLREDDSRVRMGYAGQNLAMVRKLVLNLLKKKTAGSGSIRSKRLKAGWNPAYLLEVLQG